ncbi:MAG: ATP-binding protein [Lacipirellulaceae bacterium]
MPSLFVIQGRDQGHRYQLDSPEVSIGRVGDNTIQLHDTEVSRKHAVLQESGGGYVLRDLNSSNGTHVNGKPVRERRLMSGDQLQMGRTLLLFTGSQDSLEVVRGDIDIAGPGRDDGSRILRTISQAEGSDLLATPADQTQSPWLARARSNLQLMYRTAIAVSHTLDIDQLIARIMDMIFEWVDADRGCILLRDDETGQLTPRVRRHRRGVDGSAAANPAHGEERAKISISKTILDYVVERREGVLTSNAVDDDRWDPAKSIMAMGVREAICVPMQGRYDLVGVIYIDTSSTAKEILERRSANKFGEEHLKLMIAIAHQAALAVEDTSHYRAMVQAERLAAVGQTIATLSHHIKNILQGVRGGSYLIELGLGDHAKALDETSGEEADLNAARRAVSTVNKGWAIVEKNQERISSLVLDMLTYSKEREPEPEVASLVATVGDVVELMRTRASEAGVEIRWSPQSSPPRLMFDPEAVHRAVLNLVTNAIDACEGRDPALVEVSATINEQSGIANVVVRDTGIGIDKSRLGAIFNAFVSGKGSRGTGLGLAVTRKIAEEHGGTVHVASEPNVGSTFTLEFPYVPPPTGAEAATNESVGMETLSGFHDDEEEAVPLSADRPDTPSLL